MKRIFATIGIVVTAAILAAIGAAFPVTTTQAQSSPIQHVVVLDLENHSWDNVLGYWCQTATLPGGTTPRCGANDDMPSSVTLSDGTQVTPSVTPDVVPNVNHSMNSQLAAMDKGAMDGWQNEVGGGCDAAHNYQCITGYLPSQVPNIVALANTFAVNDRFFSFKDSPSWGGHMYAVAGTTDGFTGDNPVAASGVAPSPGWGCDSKEIARWGTGGAYQPSCVPDFALGLPNGGAFEPTKALYVPTIMDRLDSAGLSWKIYGAASPSDGGYIWNTCATFSECLNTSQKANVVESAQFLTDASAGTLPSFSLVVSGGSGKATQNSCHNGFSMTACDNYVGQVANAIMTSPQWSSTALIITWDDYGGFYDSAPPAINLDGTQQGIRLPLIVVSPYAVPALTDATQATFASILAFTEHTFGLAPLEQNDASAYDLSSMFNLGGAVNLHSRPRMVIRHQPAGERIDWAAANQDT